MEASTATARELPVAAATRTRTNLQQAAQRFVHHRLAMAGLVITLVLILVALLAPFIAPTPYYSLISRKPTSFRATSTYSVQTRLVMIS